MHNIHAHIHAQHSCTRRRTEDTGRRCNPGGLKILLMKVKTSINLCAQDEMSGIEVMLIRGRRGKVEDKGKMGERKERK